MFKMIRLILSDIYYDISLRILEYRVIKQLEKEKKGKKNNLNDMYKKYDNVVMINFKRKDKECEEKYPDLKY